jgi:hypothetical protein
MKNAATARLAEFTNPHSPMRTHQSAFSNRNPAFGRKMVIPSKARNPLSRAAPVTSPAEC